MALIITPIGPAERKLRRGSDREEPVVRIFRKAVANANNFGINSRRLENLTAPGVRLSAEDLDVLTREVAKKEPSQPHAPYVDQGAYDGQFPPAYTNPHVPGGLIDERG